MATPGTAVPGTPVPASSLIGPGGAQGIQGIQGGAPFTTTTADFTMPAAGGSVNVNVADASWVIIGEMVAIQTAGGNASTAASLRCTAKIGNQLTLQYNPPTTLPLASNAGPGLMAQLSGNTTDFVDGTNACQNLANAVTPLVTPSITAVRLRSFSSIGNPAFEVDQRNVGVAGNLAAGATGRWIDRWNCTKNLATGVLNYGQAIPPTPILVPGTGFRIALYCAALTLTTPQATLAAGEYIQILQYVEGPLLRELISDAHSISVLAYCTQPLSFTVGLQSPSSTYYSLTKLCTISAANQWTLFPLPNLPVWPSGAAWPLAPGNNGYIFRLGLGAGSTYTSPANDTWQTGANGFICGPGTTNFASLPANTNFFVGFVQHEPGSQCTTLMDKPFTQAYDEALRYYQKSYDYEIAPGAANATNGAVSMWQNSTTGFYGATRFSKPMAKAPTLTGYEWSTGAANSIRFSGVSYAITSISGSGKTGFNGVATATLPAVVAGATASLHFTADTGW